MPSVMLGPAVVYTPSAADSVYPNYTGVSVEDPVNFAAHNPTNIEAKYLLKPLQDELLKHQQLLQTLIIQLQNVPRTYVMSLNYTNLTATISNFKGTIASIAVMVDTVFDSGALEIGLSGTPEKYLAATDVDMDIVGVSQVNPQIVESSPVNVIVQITGAPTTGSLRIEIVAYGGL